MLKILFFSLPMLFLNNLLADVHEGKQLFYENNCLECHNVEKFKYRKDKVSDFDKLHSMVDACSSNAGTGWFDEETMDVSSYLNHHYYQFKKIKD